MPTITDKSELVAIRHNIEAIKERTERASFYSKDLQITLVKALEESIEKLNELIKK